MVKGSFSPLEGSGNFFRRNDKKSSVADSGGNRKVHCLIFLLLAINFSSRAANRYWVGPSSSSWHSTSNWSNTSGGSGGFSIPGSTDVAIFDGGSTANCAINSGVEVLGILINNGYTGTITLSGGASLVINSSGFEQTGGTFTGSGGDMYVQGPFDLMGGLFTTTGILDVEMVGNSAPPPDIYMGFENPSEPLEPPFYRPANPNGTGNGCLETTTWNVYYVRDVCISPTVDVNHYAIERSTQQKRSGSHSLRFYLKPTPLNQWPSGGEATHRAELGPKYNSPVNHYPAAGEEVWYGLSYYFPNDFVFAPENIENDIRFVIAQWQHGSPGSSIIALEVIGDEIMLQRQTGNSTSSTWVTPDTIVTITRGQWMDMVFRVKWSRTGGIVQCWVNGQQKLNLNNIQTVYNNLSNGGGLKPGIYYWRWKDQQSVQNTLNAGITHREIFIDEIRQYKGTNGYQSVVPGG